MPVFPLTETTTTAVSRTGRDLVEETRRILFSGTREPRNRLAADLSADATSLVLEFPTKGIAPDSRLSIDLELLSVWAVDEAAKTVTVDRGQWGSTAVGHADNSTVTINPRFPDFDIFTALNQELRSLSGEGLFRIRAVDLPYSPSIQGYDLADVEDLLQPYALNARLQSSRNTWPAITKYRIARSMATADFPSTNAIFLYEGGVSGQPIRFSYKAAFDVLTSLTDNVYEVSGLHPEAHDILALGAAIRLAAPTEIKRNFTESQGDTRRADEVPPGARANSARFLEGLRARRIVTERARLHQMYPVVKR